jgi:hypothetical protein
MAASGVTRTNLAMEVENNHYKLDMSRDDF